MGENCNWFFVVKGICVFKSCDVLRVCYFYYKKEMFNYFIWVVLVVF